MAPDHLGPSPVSSPFSDTDFPLFVASRSKNHGGALIPSKTEDLAKSVNPVSPPSSTLPEPLTESPKEPPKPSHPSPHLPSNLSSSLLPTFHSVYVLSLLVEVLEAPSKSISAILWTILLARAQEWDRLGRAPLQLRKSTALRWTSQGRLELTGMVY
ncbi:hypothetical protein Nepgr_016380 [Nepenthes gracilis]|uniref:Uncharacterized protein n=1 Tax=Nepenthes gracilis TaxID=150966 RepID=A0AAD3SPL0_NEPGR|nr:hypothetical protein Nepgr_016380 [Nepenthes gracilis]